MYGWVIIVRVTGAAVKAGTAQHRGFLPRPSGDGALVKLTLFGDSGRQMA